MRKIYTLLFLFLCAVATSFAGDHCMQCKQVIFKQNKGQWENNILYKVELKNGAIFFENNVITFNLFDTRDVLRIKGDHHKLENYTPTIDYSMNFHAFKMKFENANGAVKTTGSEAIGEYFNYFIGSDKTKWASKVQGFKQVTYSNLYMGVNLEVSSKEQALKYVYEAAAGADVSRLRISFDGTDGLNIDDAGNLIIKTSVGDVMDLKPYAYQMINGKETEVSCTFTLSGTTVSYSFPKGYDKKLKLFIDPTLVFSTYSGSTVDNFGYSATYDSKGNAFGAGSVFGVGYPLVVGHYIMSYVGGSTIFFTSGGSYPGDDIGITKYSADGTQRIYSTYLGGYGQDLPHSLIANSNDELYMLGTTDCSNYPVTSGAYDTTYNGGNDPGVWDGIAAHYKRGSDIVISRISVDGSQLLSSTYVGGSGNDGLNYRAGQPYASPGFLRHNYADEVRGEIEIDKNNNIYIASCTRSTDFPRTQGTFQNTFGGGMDACIFKMDASLNTMIWSTTFGGTEDDAAYSVSVDGDENLFVAGGTVSNNFPVTNGVYQNTFGGGTCDGFITHINKNGQTRIASTYFGFGDYDQIYFVDLDKANNVYVLGQVDNSASEYIKNAAYSKVNGGQFISKFNEALDTLIWSTSWGRGLGVTDISPTAFLVDVCSNIYACGWGSQGVNNIVGGTGGTIGLDVTPNAYKGTTDGQDFYLLVMKDDASAISYATFMGGGISEEHVDGGTSRFDRKGMVYQSVCAGCGSNDDFPTTPGAVSRTNNSNNCNNAVFKFDLDLPICLADFTNPNACLNLPVQFTNESSSVLNPTYQWLFGDGGSSTQTNPTHTYATTGLYDVRLVITDPGSCNGTDTISKKILVIGGNGNDTLAPASICKGQFAQIGIPPNTDSTITYLWSPTASLSAANVPNPVASPPVTTGYRLLLNNGVCVDTFYQVVNVITDDLIVTATTPDCAGDTIVLSATSSAGNTFINYTWTPAGLIIAGATTLNPLAVAYTDTTFHVTVQTAQGCFFTDSVRVHVASAVIVDADFILPPSGCVPDTAQFTVTGNPGAGANFEWRFGDGGSSVLQNPQHIYTQSGLFDVTLIVRNNNTCNKVDSVTKQLIFLGDTTYSLPPVTICVGDTAQLGFTSGATGITYAWQPGASLSSTTISDPRAFPTDTTAYLLEVSNSICSDSIFQVVNVVKDSIFVSGDNLVCANSNVTLQVNHLNSLVALTYNWSPDANIVSGDSTNSVVVTLAQPTTFVVVAQNIYGCRYADSLRVQIYPNAANVTATAEPDTIRPGQTSQLLADSVNAVWLMWNADSTLSAVDIVNPVASPTQTHKYVVQVRDENNCAKTDTVIVYIEPTPCEQSNIYIPNAFSPNADGKNDVLYARANNVTRIYFAVYDRWGQKMFETKDITKGWDGTFKGKKIDPAVFGWYAEGECLGGNKFELKGNVTLIR
jgi:gliding motility-associated-like protein